MRRWPTFVRAAGGCAHVLRDYGHQDPAARSDLASSVRRSGETLACFIGSRRERAPHLLLHAVLESLFPDLHHGRGTRSSEIPHSAHWGREWDPHHVCRPRSLYVPDGVADCRPRGGIPDGMLGNPATSPGLLAPVRSWNSSTLHAWNGFLRARSKHAGTGLRLVRRCSHCTLDPSCTGAWEPKKDLHERMPLLQFQCRCRHPHLRGGTCKRLWTARRWQRSRPLNPGLNLHRTFFLPIATGAVREACRGSSACDGFCDSS
mmetsp:Transcript_27259/g.51071  ORF Transcript_27259/g.51071 Transcript_27259/m.51071 type:complete len:261 (-) Transcript_27259:757-1539(-)